MNDVKPGVKTSEFWITAIVNIAGAVVAVLAARGLMTQEEGDLWLVLVRTVGMAMIPLALALVNVAYIQSRGKIKTGGQERG